ncbi:MAG: Gfo/Idh/MocA family oxidoreductase [Armatimonadetes bacterium]|nr:Gfo/Idh/MocA family oxidoreductase [Armatimonadota bacterium]
MSRYRVGVIGLGRIASTIDDEVKRKYASTMLPYSHVASYMEVPEVEVVAGSDVLADKRAAFTERWGVEAVYEDYRAMLAAEKPDIVSVCTRTEDRQEAVMACAEAGVRAIYAEKPIAISLADADAMVAACEARGAVLAVGCTRRWDPWHVRARELVDEGLLGERLNIIGMLQCGLSHNGSHLIDIVRWHAGNANVDYVFGDMSSDEAAASDEDLSGNGYLHFSNGATGWIRATNCGNIGGVEVEVLCTNGRLRGVGNGIDWELWLRAAEAGLTGYAKAAFPRPQRLLSANVNAVYNLIECIEQGREPNCSGKDGRAALEIAIALRQSHRERARIDLPLADRSLKMVAKA